MKKLFLFFVFTAVAVTGCEGTCTIEFVIINQADSDIIVAMGLTGEQIIIESGKKQIVDWQSVLCAPEGMRGPFSDDGSRLLYADMYVDETIVPETIWTIKYWDPVLHDRFALTYTLTVTDELLESLLSEETH
jgi:hypothetical protein